MCRRACLVAESHPTLCDPMDCSPPDSSVHGISQARILRWVAISFSRESFDPGVEPTSPALQADSVPLCHLRSPCHYHTHHYSSDCTLIIKATLLIKWIYSDKISYHLWYGMVYHTRALALHITFTVNSAEFVFKNIFSVAHDHQWLQSRQNLWKYNKSQIKTAKSWSIILPFW